MNTQLDIPTTKKNLSALGKNGCPVQVLLDVHGFELDQDREMGQWGPMGPWLSKNRPNGRSVHPKIESGPIPNGPPDQVSGDIEL